MQDIIEAAERYEHHGMPLSVTKNISKQILKVQTDAFITKNNYKPPGKYSNNQQRNRSFHKLASNDQSLNRKFDSKRYTPVSTVIQNRPFCTLENNKCKYGRQHKCSLCTKPGCRALNHNLQPRTHANLSSSTGDFIDDSLLVNKIINGVNSLLTARKDNVEYDQAPSPNYRKILSRHGKRLSKFSTPIGFGSCKSKHFMDINNIHCY